MLTKAGPTGGAGVAFAAGKANLINAVIFLAMKINSNYLIFNFFKITLEISISLFRVTCYVIFLFIGKKILIQKF
jgi:hypothetical protein